MHVSLPELTLAPVPAVATVRQKSHSTPVPAAATVQQQGALFGAACPYRAFTPRRGAADYLTYGT